MMKSTKKTQDIFDLSDVSDLPQDIKKQLGMPVFKKEECKNLYELFTLKPRLKIDEIIVAFHRKYKKVVNREWLQCTLNNFRTYNLVKRVEKNEYQLVRNI